MEANYFKKATGMTFFTCGEGMEIANVVREAGISAEGKSITVKTTGTNENGELIAEFLFTWSFKTRR